MLDRNNIEETLKEMARQQGHELNGQDKLIIRTRLNSALSAKERHRQRMTAPEYRWRKPAPRR
ncbi:hypothetical protein [Citrobacter sp. BDA59-3]|uniref:hypothetical protein n=1 Tax=Citrobacter sp. BDA59-3 TaxID=2781952 RepID=UPI0018824042|nr:hypothetical protein [Citrobacter sp. BDA59-3]QOV70571.1 hypothetical protein IP582_09360 [Citrobacter sp. BDA59-3]